MGKIFLMKLNVAVLVISFDGFSDLWDPYFKSIEKFWIDCPFETFLQTNEKTFKHKMLKGTIPVGEDVSWSSNLLKSVRKLRTYDYLLVMMEDGLLRKSVDTKTMLATIESFIKLKGKFLTLITEGQLKPHNTINEYFGEIAVGTPYRVTATYSVWERKFLEKFIVEDENPFQFEKIGSRRSDKYADGFYSVHERQFDLIHAVWKGRWHPRSFKESKDLGYINFTERKFLSFFDVVRIIIYSKVRAFIFFITPKSLKKFLIRNKEYA